MVYANRNEAEVGLGLSLEFERLIDEWSAVQGKNAGFIGGTLLQSFANPPRYALLSRWVDRDASIAAGRRDEFVAFAQKFRNSGVSRPTRLTEAYDGIFEVDKPNVGMDDGKAERWVDFTLSTPAAAPELENHMRKVADVGIRAPGIVSIRLRRSMGFDTRYLLLVIASDHAAARGWIQIPEVRAFTEGPTSIANRLASPPSAEIYHVVKRYAGPALAAAEPALAGVASSP